MNIERLKLDLDRLILIHYPADNRKVMKAELLEEYVLNTGFSRSAPFRATHVHPGGDC
jgi:hypothetical protein